MGGVDKGWYKDLMEGDYMSVWLDGLASCLCLKTIVQSKLLLCL